MKRAQFSLEFILTYGWVFFIAVAGLAVIYATGIFSFSDLLPEHCQFLGQIQCIESQITSTGTGVGSFKVKVANGFGVDLIVYNATLMDANGVTCTGIPYSGVQWPIDSQVELNVTSCTGQNINKGTRFSGSIVLTFYRNNTWCNPTPTSCLYTGVGDLLLKIS